MGEGIWGGIMEDEFGFFLFGLNIAEELSLFFLGFRVWRVGGGSNPLVIFANGTIQVGGMSFLSLFSNPFLLGSAKSLISMGAPFDLISFIFEEAIQLFFSF